MLFSIPNDILLFSPPLWKPPKFTPHLLNLSRSRIARMPVSKGHIVLWVEDVERHSSGEALDLYVRIVVFEDLLVTVTLLSHHGSTYLAKSYAVSPTTSVKDKSLWNTISDILRLNGKGAALQG